jgi:anti-anti-sigma factor
MSLHVPSQPPGSATAASGEGTPFSVSVDRPSGWVSVAGELDREHAHQVLDALLSLAASGHAHWTLDARPITFCDAEGLRTLVLAHRLAIRSGRTLSVLPSPCMHRLVLLVGLDQLLDTPPAPASVQTGVAECRRSRRSLAAVRDLRRSTSVPGAAVAAG